MLHTKIGSVGPQPDFFTPIPRQMTEIACNHCILAPRPQPNWHLPEKNIWTNFLAQMNTTNFGLSRCKMAEISICSLPTESKIETVTTFALPTWVGEFFYAHF